MSTDSSKGAQTVVVFSGGESVPPRNRPAIPRGAYVIAADSGLDHARAAGRPVDLVVGDLDSVSATALAAARNTGAEVREYPADKDLTDLQLALDAAIEREPERILVVGGHGGRVDHFFGNALLVTSPLYASAEIEVVFGAARAHVVHGGQPPRTMEATEGQLCSLLAVHGLAEGVRTTGLKWELDDEHLEAGTSRGLSNEVQAATVTVELAAGTLLVVFPGAAG